MFLLSDDDSCVVCFIKLFSKGKCIKEASRPSMTGTLQSDLLGPNYHCLPATLLVAQLKVLHNLMNVLQMIALCKQNVSESETDKSVV